MADPTSTAHPARRLGLLLAGLLLLFLIVSLAVHLAGRARFAEAAERFLSELGDEVPDLGPEALRAQIAGFAPETPPEPENAARWLIAGGKAMVWGEGEETVVRELSRTPTSQWTAEQTALARDMVDRNRGGLETLQRAAPLTGSDYGVAYDDFIDAEIPNLVELLDAAHLLNLNARLALAEGDSERALASLDTLSRLDDTLRRETILIFALVAHVTEKLLLQGITEVLIAAESWAAGPEVLDHLERLLPTGDLLAFGRKIVALDAAVTSVAALEGRADLWTEGTDSRIRAYYFGHRRAAAYLDQGRQTAALAHEPYSEFRDRYSFRLGDNSPGNIAPSYRNALAKGQVAMSQRRLVTAALELRRAGLGQGAYPATCPPSEVLDAPDPFVGQPLVCQPSDDGSLHLEVPGAAGLIDEVARAPSLWIFELDLPAPAAGS